MSEVKHTPLPWATEESILPFYNDANGYSCGGGGSGVCTIYRTDKDGNSVWLENGDLDEVSVFSVHNAAFIVRACNSHYDLLEALKALFKSYKDLADSGDAGFWKVEDLPEGKQALAALAKAEGR